MMEHFSSPETNFFIQSAQFTDIKEIARVHVNSWCESYDGIISKKYLESLKYTDKETMWEQFIPRRPGHGGTLVVKTSDGEVIGFSDFGPAREHEHGFDSEIYAFYLLKKYHGKGLGRELLKRTFQKLKEDGYSTSYLWVFKENPSKGFYEKLDGTYLKSMSIQVGEESHIEDLYYWDL
ncbi:MAG: GNAT family N-acetyltransferase [Bdellovibrionota bacterium]|nr:GNAT family N-acetyltransferase [Bdellovibrionota bacterium]